MKILYNKSEIYVDHHSIKSVKSTYDFSKYLLTSISMTTDLYDLKLLFNHCENINTNPKPVKVLSTKIVILRNNIKILFMGVASGGITPKHNFTASKSRRRCSGQSIGGIS